MMSTHVWNTFSDIEQKWIQEAMNLSVIEQRKLWRISEQESLEAVKEAGVKVSYPNKSLFVNKSKSVIENYEQNPVIKSFIERIKNTL